MAGIGLLVIFTCFLIKSTKRYGVAKALFSVDIILGIVAGVYLVITSILSMMNK
jgi:hypothetical protein